MGKNHKHAHYIHKHTFLNIHLEITITTSSNSVISRSLHRRDWNFTHVHSFGKTLNVSPFLLMKSHTSFYKHTSCKASFITSGLMVASEERLSWSCWCLCWNEGLIFLNTDTWRHVWGLDQEGWRRWRLLTTSEISKLLDVFVLSYKGWNTSESFLCETCRKTKGKMWICLGI